MFRHRLESYLPCYSERGLNETLEEAKEFAQISRAVKLCKGAWFLPVLKAEPLAERITAQHRDESEENQGDNQKYFSQGGPEFALAVPLHGEQVDEPESILRSDACGYTGKVARVNSPI